MANAVSRVILTDVGFILAPRLADALQIGAELFRRKRQQRTDDVPPPRPHGAKPADVASPRRVQQHGFRLIPLMVRQRDCVRADSFRRLHQGIIAQRPRSVFKAALMCPGIGRYIHPTAVKRYVLLCAQRLHKAHILHRGCAANAVLYECTGDLKRKRFPNFIEKAQQRRRIRTAAYRDQHMFAGRNPARFL